MKATTLGAVGVAALLWWATSEPTFGNLFVVDEAPFDGSGFTQGTIGEYTNSGVPINASLITGLTSPRSNRWAGGFIYVANTAAGTIGKYTTSGKTIDASLIIGLHTPLDIEVFGGNLMSCRTWGVFCTLADWANTRLPAQR